MSLSSPACQYIDTSVMTLEGKELQSPIWEERASKFLTLLLVHLSQSVMIGYELEPSRRRFLPKLQSVVLTVE